MSEGLSPPPPPPPPPSPTRRNRLPLVMAMVAALLLAGAAVTVPLVLDDDTPDAGPVDAQEAPVDLSEVVTFTTLRSDHVTETVDDYESSPPAGGRHFPVWLDCGVYEERVRDEFTVHDLEHGAFWFAYDPTALDDGEVAALAEDLPDNGIMTPYDGLDAPVVVMVWEAQLALTGIDDPRLPLFLDAYAGGVTAPEPFASCAGGASLADIAELELPTDLTAG